MNIILLLILGAIGGYFAHLMIEANDGIPGINFNPGTKSALSRIIIGGVGLAVLGFAFEVLSSIIA
jgi:H+/Cl- antiporter ClcA